MQPVQTVSPVAVGELAEKDYLIYRGQWAKFAARLPDARWFNGLPLANLNPWDWTKEPELDDTPVVAFFRADGIYCEFVGDRPKPPCSNGRRHVLSWAGVLRGRDRKFLVPRLAGNRPKLKPMDF